MYNLIEEILVMSNIAERLNELLNLDKDGNTVQNKSKGYGFKVIIRSTRPDMCLALDKCGNNISQEGDSRIGQ